MDPKPPQNTPPPPEQWPPERKLMTAYVLLFLSISLPVAGLPVSISAFFFPQSGTLFAWLIGNFWIGLFLLFFIICPFIGLNGIQLAADSARNGVKNRLASARIPLIFLVISLPILISIARILTLF